MITTPMVVGARLASLRVRPALSPARLAAALCRRELGAGLLLTSAAFAGMAYFAAERAAAMRAAGSMAPLVGRLLTRFDLTALGIAVLIVVLRGAQRIAEDRGAGWLDGYRANGGSAAAYATGMLAATAAVGLVLFAPAATTFAVSVQVHDGVAELLHELPLLLTGGACLLLIHAAAAVLLGLLAREALATVAAWAIVTLGPPFALTWQTLRTDGTWLPSDAVRLLLHMAPPLAPPIGVLPTAAAALWISACAALAALAAHRLAGRRA